MKFMKMQSEHHMRERAGNVAVIILVIAAGIALGTLLFSRYDAEQAADSDDSAFPEISEEADVDSMREKLEEIRDDREAEMAERDEQTGDEDSPEPESGADEAGTTSSENEDGHVDERGEDTSDDPYGPDGPDQSGDDSSAEDDDSQQVAYTGTRLAGTAALPMLRFNQADYDRAVAANEVIVLMFHTDWCPLCQAEEPDSRAAFDQLAEQGVDGVVGFRVHFDDEEETAEEKAIAEQYNVGFRSSKIIVSNGGVVSQASYETWSTARYKSEIQAAL